MKAITYNTAGPLDGAGALSDVEITKPTPTGCDLLVEIQAISVNPVDAKIRQNRPPVDGASPILGWDAVGVVVETGDDVSMFKTGDTVWYAGAINRAGTNAEFHLVDERLVGNAVVIIGGSGGVGSIAIQLLRALTDMTVIATASRPETQAWVTELGAHHVIDHSKPLTPQIEALGIGQPGYVFSTNQTGDYVAQIAELIAPQGRFGLIDDPAELDIKPFKPKSVSTHWEFMYTRSMFQTDDMTHQHYILNEVAELLDAGKIKSTATQTLGVINAANLTKAHTILESNKARGKLVLEGF